MRTLAGRLALTAAVAAIIVLVAAEVAAASTVVAVSLWDKGAETTMATGMAYGTAGADMSKATMGIKASPATAKAGVVTFKVTNDSRDTVHEMIVMTLAEPPTALPYIDNEMRVDEDKSGDKGEVSELDPGKSGALTVNLKPGNYVLICNVPGHFAAGMWTEFTVTK